MGQLQDIKISGAGVHSGGKFNQIKILGKGTINGEVEAKEIQINGAGEFKQKVKAKELNVNGSAEIEGDVEVDKLKINGTCEVDGQGKVNEIRIKGRCKFKKHLKANIIQSYGKLTVDSEVEAEEFSSFGSFDIQGLLNSHFIDISIGGTCYAEEIGGEEIRIKFDDSFPIKLLAKFFPGNSFQKLKAKTIEGTKIHLEYTEADVIRGNHVQIGPNCHIKKVEYTETLQIDPSAKVEERIKL